jgi:phosphoglycerol transferase
LAHYAVIPIGVLLAVRAASGRSLRSEQAPRWHIVGWVAACIAVGSFGVYYAIFSIFTIVLCAAASATSNRTIRPLLAGAWLSVLIVGTVVVNLAGSLFFWSRNGSNEIVGSRIALETDLYGLRLIQMLSPVPGTPLPFPDSVDATLAEGFQSEPSQYFGVVSALCLLGILAWLLHRAVAGSLAEHATALAPLLGALAVAWLLIASTGGLSWIGWLAGFERIRGWGRVSILVQFVVLAWACQLAPRAVAAFAERRGVRPAMFVWPICVGVLAIAVVDQGTDSVRSTPGENEAVYESDRSFFVGIESELPLGSAVAQLPIRRFPEELPRFRSVDYDLLRPFVHTTDLRWSYGGMKGRESDWQTFITESPTFEQVKTFVAFGFTAVVVDRFGYEDNGAALETELVALTGKDLRVSSDQRWSFIRLDDMATAFDQAALEALRADLEAAAAQL